MAWQVEIDPYCREVLADHWPNVTRYADIKELDPDVLEPVDLVAGDVVAFTESHALRRVLRR